MISYYFGSDEFGSIIKSKESNVPQRVDQEFDSVVLNLQLCLYRTNKSTWLGRGFGMSDCTEIFPANLNVSQAVLCKSIAFGLSVVNNTLYQLNLNSDLNEKYVSQVQLASHEEKEELDSGELQTSTISTRLLQIATSDDNVFALDDQSGIYRVPDFLFRLKNMKIVKISCGFDHLLMLTDAGAIYSWGNGSRGQMGSPDIEIKCNVPKRVEFFDDLPCTIFDVVAGGWHSLALTSDGDIYSWGWNQASQCGHSLDKLTSVIRQPYPVDLGSGVNPVVGISAGARHSLALLKNGEVYSWGWNKYGQLGVGDNIDRSVPTQIQCDQFKAHRPVSVVCGRWGSLIICELTGGQAP